MNLDHYDYFDDDSHRAYSFYSAGPRGNIRKLVTFTLIPNTLPSVYNLAFGDESPITGDLDDLVNTNNQDRDIVLATVANIVVEFCHYYTNHYIYAKGSTASRTRLYQMGIASLWEEINKEFYVYGLVGDDWQEFEPNSINYNAILVRRKH